jgi:molecular chaperone GrpE
MTEKSPTVEDVPATETPAAEPVDKAGELLTKLRYLQAEFENYRKRVERDAQAIVKFAHEGLLVRLLPVLDEMDVAVDALSGEAGQGVRMVRDNLAKTLREAGLHEIPALGRPFDPYQMDAVEHVTEKDSKDGFVKKVLRKGYRLHDRVLRPAQVIVVRNEGDTNG